MYVSYAMPVELILAVIAVIAMIVASVPIAMIAVISVNGSVRIAVGVGHAVVVMPVLGIGRKSYSAHLTGNN